MPISQSSACASPVLQNLASAAVVGVVTLLRPTRFPKLARRGLSWANTAGSIFMGAKRKDSVPEKRHPLGIAVDASSALAGVTGASILLTSGIGIKVDAKIERLLLKQGVKHPRTWMAIGVGGIVFATQTVQDVMAKKTQIRGLSSDTTLKVKPSVSANIPKSATAPKLESVPRNTYRTDRSE